MNDSRILSLHSCLWRFLLAADTKHIATINADEVLVTSDKCDNSNISDSINGSDKRKCSDVEESTSQEPSKRKKWDKKNRGQNKVEEIGIGLVELSCWWDSNRYTWACLDLIGKHIFILVVFQNSSIYLFTSHDTKIDFITSKRIICASLCSMAWTVERNALTKSVNLFTTFTSTWGTNPRM